MSLDIVIDGYDLSRHLERLFMLIKYNLKNTLPKSVFYCTNLYLYKVHSLVQCQFFFIIPCSLLVDISRY